MNTNDMPRRWSPSRVSLPPFLLFALTLLAPAASAANPNHIAGVSWLGKSVFLTSAYNNPGVADAQIYDLALNKWNQVPNFTRPSFPLDPGSPNAITGDVFQGLLCFFSVPPRASGAPAVLELHTMDMTGKWSEAKAVPLVTPWGTSPTSIQRVRAKTYMGRLFLFVDFVNPPLSGEGGTSGPAGRSIRRSRRGSTWRVPPFPRISSPSSSSRRSRARRPVSRCTGG